MITRHKHEGRIYVLSNEGIEVGDEVFPISQGRLVNDEYQHREFDFRWFMSGFPSDPHKMLDLEHSDYRPFQCRTDHGFGPIEKYFRIVDECVTADAHLTEEEKAKLEAAGWINSDDRVPEDDTPVQLLIDQRLDPIAVTRHQIFTNIQCKIPPLVRIEFGQMVWKDRNGFPIWKRVNDSAGPQFTHVTFWKPTDPLPIC